MIPSGYEGVVLKKTNRSEVLASESNDGDGDDGGEMQVEDGDDEREEVQVVETLSDQHEDVYVRGISEWTALAGAVRKSSVKRLLRRSADHHADTRI
jgi:hypothetical protein